MDRLADWVVTKQYALKAFGVLLLVAINFAAYILAAFYGSWISTLCIGLIVIGLSLEFIIPLIANLTKHQHLSNLQESKTRVHHHPLEMRHVSLRHFRIVRSANPASSKRFPPYQKKLNT
jgi:hypothetical protein